MCEYNSVKFFTLNIATTNFLHYRIENTHPAQTHDFRILSYKQ